MTRPAFVLAALLVLASPSTAAPAFEPASGLRAVTIVEGLEAPLFVCAPPGDARLFVVEQPGRIRIVRDGKLLPTPFLDVSALVSYGGERGLLGLAFHPMYAKNGWFYVNYTDRNGDTRVERYHVSRNPDVAEPGSAQLVITIAQPYANHNGGMVAFGHDGMLYIGMGDGGSHGDPHGNGQNLQALLGKLLRLDVDHGLPYTIPRDNPYAGRSDARGEIWASGTRNPWRFSFDRDSPTLYIGDVGQDHYEEVDVVDARTPGLDYGWNLREGLHRFHDGEPARRLTEPVVEYSHDEGCSVTGGYCYRGHELAGFSGTYFFSDYCKGWLRSFRWQAGRVSEKKAWRMPSMGPVTSFGEDARGELYVTTQTGRVLKLALAAK